MTDTITFIKEKLHSLAQLPIKIFQDLAKMSKMVKITGKEAKIIERE
jgi:hypothetical protein